MKVSTAASNKIKKELQLFIHTRNKMEPIKVVPVQQAVQVMPQQAQVVSVGASSNMMDAVSFQNLAAVTQLEFKQGNVLWEAFTGGGAANSYMITERNSGQAIFIMQEESECCCRYCCNPSQPAFVKFYNSSPPFPVPKTGCCCCVRPAYNKFNKVGQPVLTFEKSGMCDNLAQCGVTNCCVLSSICQSEAWMHTGNIPTTYNPQGCACLKVESWDFPAGKPGKAIKTNMFAHSIVPIGGGGCTPTVNLMSRQSNNGPETQFAVVEGPTFFGGCMDLCCTTKFTVSSQKGKSGDLAIITKKAPEGAGGICMALCTPADKYNLDFTAEGNLTPQQKAVIIGEMVHLDFLFFEADQPLCHQSDDGKMCYILLCTCYCMGALCPVECCFPLQQN